MPNLVSLGGIWLTWKTSANVLLPTESTNTNALNVTQGGQVQTKPGCTSTACTHDLAQSSCDPARTEPQSEQAAL